MMSQIIPGWPVGVLISVALLILGGGLVAYGWYLFGQPMSIQKQQGFLCMSFGGVLIVVGVLIVGVIFYAYSRLKSG